MEGADIRIKERFSIHIQLPFWRTAKASTVWPSKALSDLLCIYFLLALLI
jgi:hypothetical protein